MKNIILSLLACIVFLGCNSIEKPKKPKNLIPKDKMVDIMFDVLLLNSAKGLQKKTLEMNGVFPEDYVYTKYNIDSLQFALSNDYYAYNAKMYKEIIDEVNTRVTIKKVEFEELRLKEEKLEKAKRDSIKNAKEAIKPVKITDDIKKNKKGN